MTARVITGWSLHGLEAYVLHNSRLRVVVLPEIGGKIWQITDLATGRDVIWHNDRLRPRAVPVGTGYDDNFLGGWDELFPNDEPEVLAGEPFPDHGELWSAPWTASVLSPGGGDQAARLLLRMTGPVSGCLVEKVIELAPGARHVTVRSRIENQSSRPLPFLWKQHLPVSLDQAGRVDVPAASTYLEDFGSPRTERTLTELDWPVHADANGQDVDLRPTLGPDADVAEFQYLTGLSAGWCAVTRADGTGVALAFDPEVFPSCWLFGTYGGWRGLHTLILEPCTGTPVSVADGVAAGTHRVLAPGEVLETELVAVAYDGLAEVSRVGLDGLVEGRPLNPALEGAR